MTFEEVVQRFPGGRMTPRGEYEVRCTAHEDRRASLGIKAGKNGGVVMNCQAGCANERILQTVGLTLADLAPPSAKQANGHVRAGETVYVYHDEQGNGLFEVVRTADKHFWQRLPNQKTGGIGETRRVLFELPDLLKAPADQPVLIVEGEKDCWRLRRLGLTATTNPGGAGKWLQSYTDWLKAHLPLTNFVILADNDAPGLKHAEEVEASLKRAGLDVRSVLLPDLPPKGDVSDWLAGGKTREDLLEAIRPAPPRLYTKLLTFNELLATIPPDFRVEGLVFEQSLVEIYGPPNEGKTFVMLDFCMAIRTGNPWCGREILKPGPIVYVNADGGPGFSDRGRAWKAIHRDVEDAFEFFTHQGPVALHRASDMRELREALAWMDVKPASLVFDTYSRCIPGVNENLQEFASLVVEHLDQIKNEFGMSVFLMHHTGKDEKSDRGSTVVVAAMDTVMRVTMDEAKVITLECEKQRDWEFFAPIRFQLERIPGTNFVWLQRTEVDLLNPSARREECLLKIKEIIRRDAGITREAIALALDLTRSTCGRYVETLLVRGEVVESELPRHPGQEGRRPHGLFLTPLGS